MSAVRRSGRSGARPSPYARPPSKKSSWSFSGILSYFNPLKSRVQEEILPVTEDYTDESDYNPEELGQSPAQALSTRGHQLSRTLKSKGAENESPSRPASNTANGTHQSVPQQSPTSPFVEPTSSSEGIDIVTSFLESRRDRHISSIEAEGLISLLKKSTSETREPFRFSSSPSTPQRGNSPLFASTSTSSNPFRFSTPTDSPNQLSSSTTPKLLKNNPNGKYRWQGGGSAKPRSRNRYQSPAFGTSRASSERLVLKESPEKIKTDTKRRRVGDEAESSTASPSGSSLTPPPTTRSGAPAPSPTRTALAAPLPTPNGVPSGSGKVNGINTSSSSRLRTSMIQKPTTPVVPSPLRQAWGQPSPSNSDSEGGSPVPVPKQTRAANFMTKIITEVSTTKHLDVSNPYQAASPVKHTGQPKPRSKRIRAGKSVSKIDVNGAEAGSGSQDGKEKEQEKEKEKEEEKQYSAQAIIEATLPKGSKRSRPPPATSNGPVNGSSRPSASQSPPPPAKPQFSVQIEEVEDEDEKERSPKKSKPNGHIVNGFAAKPLKSVPTIEEIPEGEVSSTSSKTAVAPSEVIEPGQKTYSFSSSANLGLGMPSSLSKGSLPVFGAPKTNTIPKAPSKLRESMKMDTPTPPAAPSSSSESTAPSPFFASKAPVADTTSSPPPASSKADPKQAALDAPVPSLPTFTFSVPATVSFNDSEAIAKAKSIPLLNLPKYEFTIAAMSSSSTASPEPKESRPTQAPPPVVGFNWSAAGIKPPPAPAQGSWTCGTCDCSNGASATQCVVCDAPR
ncbi:hypothetical protein AAF712_005797 [Marasmius tenuissimus]|uniref:RanBP2-type domain-containing protein n=1 Tax=Marasmius tenuissimus TaxID=585030 RepID=A0ABR3A3U1_9AGAR